jgi:hypothetical protein
VGVTLYKRFCRKCKVITQWYVAHGKCRPCAIAKAARWTKANKAKAAKSRRKWVLANPEKARTIRQKYHIANRSRIYALTKAWRAANPDKVKAQYKRSAKKRTAYQRLKQSGWSQAVWDAAWAQQRGKCPICRRTLRHSGTAHNSAVSDHSHKALRPRGILCRCCNTGIGMFRDNPKTLRNAASYIEAHNG